MLICLLNVFDYDLYNVSQSLRIVYSTNALSEISEYRVQTVNCMARARLPALKSRPMDMNYSKDIVIAIPR